MQRIIAPEFLSEVYFLMYSKKAWRPILSSTHVRPPNTISYLTPCVTLWLLSRFNCSIMKNIFPCQCLQALPADVPFKLALYFFFFYSMSNVLTSYWNKHTCSASRFLSSCKHLPPSCFCFNNHRSIQKLWLWGRRGKRFKRKLGFSVCGHVILLVMV